MALACVAAAGDYQLLGTRRKERGEEKKGRKQNVILTGRAIPTSGVGRVRVLQYIVLRTYSPESTFSSVAMLKCIHAQHRPKSRATWSLRCSYALYTRLSKSNHTPQLNSLFLGVCSSSSTTPRARRRERHRVTYRSQVVLRVGFRTIFRH